MPIYEFRCSSCETPSELICRYDERPPQIICPECTVGTAEYHVGSPAQFRIAIDGNGRKGYKMDMGNGKKVVRSSTRERYEHQIGNRPTADVLANRGSESKSVYTKAYQEKVDSENKVKREGLKKAIQMMKKGL